jgi:hypothetical protein
MYKYIKFIPKLEKKLTKGVGLGQLCSFVRLFHQAVATGASISLSAICEQLSQTICQLVVTVIFLCLC